MLCSVNKAGAQLLFTYVLFCHVFQSKVAFLLKLFLNTLNQLILFATFLLYTICKYRNKTLELCLLNTTFFPMYFASNLTSDIQILASLSIYAGNQIYTYFIHKNLK